MTDEERERLATAERIAVAALRLYNDTATRVEALRMLLTTKGLLTQAEFEDAAATLLQRGQEAEARAWENLRPERIAALDARFRKFEGDPQ